MSHFSFVRLVFIAYRGAALRVDSFLCDCGINSPVDRVGSEALGMETLPQ